MVCVWWLQFEDGKCPASVWTKRWACLAVFSVPRARLKIDRNDGVNLGTMELLYKLFTIQYKFKTVLVSCEEREDR